MFKTLIQFWRGKDFLQSVLEDFTGILNDTEDMFKAVSNKLIRGEEQNDLKKMIYTSDDKVNSIVKDIRKRVMSHLSLKPMIDLHVSLLLISVVKDAERIGDFSKNMLEVDGMLEKQITEPEFRDWFGNIDEEILDVFSKTKTAFAESDEKMAAQLWQNEREIVQKCDGIIAKLSKSDLPVNQAVCFTLLSRYFKRITAHLTNIATSVVLPISDLDYFDEKRINQYDL